MTIGAFDVQNYKVIVTGIYESILRAHENLQPGRIRINRGDFKPDPTTPRISLNRSKEAYARNPEGERQKYEFDTDHAITLLRLENDEGEEIGMVNWFALHATSIGKQNTLISSDNRGYAEYCFEKMKGSDHLSEKNFVAAFAQSNSGDASPNVEAQPDGVHDYERMEKVGKVLLGKAVELYGSAEEFLSGSIEYRHTFLDFSQEGALCNSGESCVAAVGVAALRGTRDGPGLIWLPTNRQWPKVTLLPKDQSCHREKVIALPTGHLTPRPWTAHALPVQVMKIGSLALLGLPLEVTTMAGRRIRETAQPVLADMGVSDVVLAGYANAYAGYLTTEQEYSAQAYEGASTLFGPGEEEVFRNNVVKLAESLRDGTSVEPGCDPPIIQEIKSALPEIVEPVSPAASVSVMSVPFEALRKLARGLYKNPGVAFDDKPLWKRFGSVVKDVEQTYHPGDKVEAVFWGGHPKNDLRTQGTFLEIRKKVGEQWVPILRDNDPSTRYVWSRTGFFRTYSLITAQWDIPDDAEPGEYKVCQYGNWKNGWKRNDIREYAGESRSFEIQDG